jgi:hypothetical protein
MSNNGVLGFIPDDGYTEKGFIKAIPELHPALHFEFRPMPYDERARLAKGMSTLQPLQQNHLYAKEMSQRIMSWDLKNGQGDPVQIDASIFLKLKPALFERLLGIMIGTDAPDEDADSKDKKELAADAADKFRSSGPG